MMTYGTNNQQITPPHHHTQDLTICGDKTSGRRIRHGLRQKMPSRLRALAVMAVMVFGGVAWGQTVTFESGDISALGAIGSVTNNSTYPWIITNTSQGSGHHGTYCIKSGNSGVASSTSEISVTVNFTNAGTISFLGGIWGEGSNYDVCKFYIDGGQQFSYGNRQTWETYSYDVTAGSHTFKWSYTKGGSVNNTGDAFFVDDIVVDMSSCAKPTSLAVSAITATSATVSWAAGESETNWVVEYSTNSDFSSAASFNVSGTPSTNLTDLTPYTTYYVRVKAICGGDESSWRTTNFKTALGIPFCEEFETSSIPAEWSQYTGLVNDVLNGTTLTNGGSWNFSNTNALGAYHARLNIYGTSCKYWLVTPELELTGGVELTFDLALTDFAYADPIEDNTAQADDRFVVLIQVNGTWTILREWNNSGSSYRYNNISSTGQNISIDLSSYAGRTVKVAFYGESTVTSNGDNDLHIDNVCFNTSCTPPSMTLSGGNLTCTLGGSCTGRTLTTNSSGTQHWTSSDPSVATVDPSTGAVTMVGAGSTTITVNVDAAGSYCARTASYTLTVKCPTIQAPTVEGGYRCDEGMVNLSATPGSGGTTCHWYTTESGG